MPLFDLGKEPGGGLQGTALPRRSDERKADKSQHRHYTESSVEVSGHWIVIQSSVCWAWRAARSVSAKHPDRMRSHFLKSPSGSGARAAKPANLRNKCIGRKRRTLPSSPCWKSGNQPGWWYLCNWRTSRKTEKVIEWITDSGLDFSASLAACRQQRNELRSY